MKMALAITAILLLGLGCAQRTPADAALPELPEDLDRYVQIADEEAARVLAAFNARPDAAELGGPFQLDEYERTVHAARVGESDIVHVRYTLQRPVEFLGHPQHFSVWVDLDTQETRVFGGR